MQSSDTTSKLLTLFQIAGLFGAAKENPARWAPKRGCKRQRRELGVKAPPPAEYSNTLGSEPANQFKFVCDGSVETIFLSACAQLPPGLPSILGNWSGFCDFPPALRASSTVSRSAASGVIAYGGRGQITDVQQPRYGQQVLDVSVESLT
jgi:hypothetical protein